MPRRAAAILAAVVSVLVVGCAGDDPEGEPLVRRIDDAVFAVESQLAAPQEYFEISATADEVSLIVARPVEGGLEADRYVWSAGEVGPVEMLGEATGSTFAASDLSFDPDDVFDRLRDELDDPMIVDFAVTGGEGRVAYDATVQSASGGVLLVLLGPGGDILAVQAE